MTVRVDLPAHLRILAGVGGEVRVELADAATLRSVIDALETQYPALLGTIREHGSGQRRAFLRFFAEEEDLSHTGMDDALPAAVAEGREPLLVVGAVAGG